MSRPSLVLAFSAVPFALLACTGGSGDSSTSSDDIVNQASPDVTVLSIASTFRQIHLVQGAAVTTGEAPNDPAFDVSQCAALPAGMLDCTRAFEAAFGAPALHHVIVSSSVARCKVVAIQTVSKAAAAANSEGIGAYYAYQSGPRSGERLVPKAKLAKVADAKLVDGTDAVVHAFVGLGACDIGGRWGGADFKPLMQFKDAASGEVYKNWDTHDNYVLASGSPNVDRRGELLQ
jgi:hypothetical protein